MRRKLFSSVFMLGMTLAMSMTAFAGWERSSNPPQQAGLDSGWWFSDGAGSYYQAWYPKNVGWYWIDGNGDNTAECYAFNEDGWLYTNTTTADGYTVNNDGAWTVDGVVQTRDLGNTDNLLYSFTPTSAKNAYKSESVQTIDGDILSNVLTMDFYEIDPSTLIVDEDGTVDPYSSESYLEYDISGKGYTQLELEVYCGSLYNEETAVNFQMEADNGESYVSVNNRTHDYYPFYKTKMVLNVAGADKVTIFYSANPYIITGTSPSLLHPEIMLPDYEVVNVPVGTKIATVHIANARFI